MTRSDHESEVSARRSDHVQGGGSSGPSQPGRPELVNYESRLWVDTVDSEANLCPGAIARPVATTVCGTHN